MKQFWAEIDSDKSGAVTFSEFSQQVSFVPSRYEGYSRKEIKGLRQALMNDVRQASWKVHTHPRNTSKELILECLGIETLVDPNVARRLIERRRAHVGAVLLEQGLQRQRGVRDIEKIARVSEEHSRASRLRAHELALIHSEL